MPESQPPRPRIVAADATTPVEVWGRGRAFNDLELNAWLAIQR